MEEWKAVPGQERYLVSSEGRVAKLMKVNPPSQRYVRINVRDAAGRIKCYLAHVWVLEAFRGPRPPGLLARHLNDVPTDNRLENLEWGTPSENQQDAVVNGGRKLKTHCPEGHEIVGPNLQVKGRRCKACNQERANAQWHGREFSPERAQERYESLING